MKLEKKNISVAHLQQAIEKNMNWQDYPVMNIKTERKLQKNLGCYFFSWADYCKNGNDTNYDTRSQWLNSKQIRRLLGDISRQSFWQLKVRKNFPDPEYSRDGIELWTKEKIKVYIEKRKG